MPRTSPFARYVHAYETPSGATRYAVASYVAHQYQWPLPASVRRASGCSGGFAPRPEASAWRYRTRAAAMAAARRLYGWYVR